jgi:putative ABC transport system permease protein
MAIPLSYNIRNLKVRAGATVMTVVGIALTLAILVFVLALLDSLRAALLSTGDPLNLLVMRQGSDAELMSDVDNPAVETIKTLPGVAVDTQGRPMVSGETVFVVVLPRADKSADVNVTVRGLTPLGIGLRPSVHLVEGKWFSTGLREIVVSTMLHKQFANARLGDNLDLGRGAWKVVGMFDGSHTIHDSEIWADVNQVNSEFDKTSVSSVLLRAKDAVAAQNLVHQISSDQRLKLDAQFETAYFGRQTSSGEIVRLIGTIVAVIMAIGSAFGAMNTMYAAVGYRAREIATLRILGFSRWSILSSFILESVFLALLGGLVGLICMVPFQGMSTGMTNLTTFSEVVFSLKLTPGVVLEALAACVVLGVVGGLAPAWRAAHQGIVAGLRN